MTYVHSTQPHTSTSFDLYEHRLARFSITIAIEADPAAMRKHSPQKQCSKRKQQVAAYMTTANKQLREAQARYKRRFDAAVMPQE